MACGLCQLDRPLVDSHLLPAAAYKLAREPHRQNPNPIVVTRGRAGSSSRQISDEFLCAECEDRFSKYGERYVLAQCARPNGFALRDVLKTLPPLVEDEQFKVFDVAGSLGSRVADYLYFAASVFWRAAARSWTLDSETIPQLRLGPYEEQLRRFLLGELPFPDGIRLFVHVWSEEHAGFTSIAPCSARAPDGTHRHKFTIPGILFIILVGKTVAREIDAGALNSNAGSFMWLCPWTRDSLFDGFGGLVMDRLRAQRHRSRQQSSRPPRRSRFR
jgi:hypothetical protein